MPTSEFIRRTHESLLAELGGLWTDGGRSGRAARDFLELFAPHAAREEEWLLPAMNALSGVETADSPPTDGMIGTLAPLLETGMARLEADHAVLRRSLSVMRKLAEEDQNVGLYDVATAAANHLSLEEEKCFPAVVLKGALILGAMEIAAGRVGPAVARASGEAPRASPTGGTP